MKNESTMLFMESWTKSSFPHINKILGGGPCSLAEKPELLPKDFTIYLDWYCHIDRPQKDIDGGKTITGKIITGKTITGKTIIGKTITGKTIMGKTITSKTITGKTITGKTITGKTITGKTITGKIITGKTITSKTITGKTITGKTITGKTIRLLVFHHRDSQWRMEDREAVMLRLRYLCRH